MPAARRTSSRTDLLEAALQLIRDGETVSLDSVARAAGLTKPGLMYHFATKEALMTALVERVTDDYARELASRLPEGEAATVERRLEAYVEWAFTADIDRADFIMFTDPRLRDQLTALWADRLRGWVDVPVGLPPARRARLLAARLIADGSWFADASTVLPLSAAERSDVWALARTLLEDPS